MSEQQTDPHGKWLIEFLGATTVALLLNLLDPRTGLGKLPLEGGDHIDQPLRINPPVSHVLLELLSPSMPRA
jgi:hypothetical protein